MRRVIILALLAAFVASAGAVSAQTLTGIVTGKVTDQQGGVLPGVTVTLTGRTGSQTQVTDAQGQYRFIGLAPGNYSVKAELQGFKPKEQTDLDVGISRTVDVPLSLAMSALAETVDVVASTVMIDTTTTATDSNMSQDLLFSMPIGYGNVAVGIMNFTPGINNGAAFGGSSDSGNSLMLDGVDVRDPAGGTAWAFFNYNIVEEVQVGTIGQPAEYGGFTGAVVNSITKSGGNRFSFLADWKYTNDSLADSDNASKADIAKNMLLADPGFNTLLNDYTVQLGGPLQKDKVFFFVSAQRYAVKTHRSGTKISREEVSPRLNMKFTFQPTSNDNISASLQYDNYNQKGRVGFLIPGYAATQDQTIIQDSPEYIWNAQYRKVFNSSTFLEAKWTGYWGYYDLNPVNTKAAHYDGQFDSFSGGAGYWSMDDRGRNQVNVALTKYADLHGSHTFKFGVEIERSTIRTRFAYNQAYFYDYGGAPSYAYGYAYDLKGKNKRESYYAQDQWKLNRVTLNLGIRADGIRGEATETGKNLYSTFSVAPRLGFAWDVTGKGASVVKGAYGQYYDGAVFYSWSRAAPGMTPNFVYIPSADWSKLTVDSSTLRQYTVNNDVNHPRVDEFNFAYEQMFGKDFKVTATVIKRDWANFINSTMPAAIWSAIPYPDPSTPGGPATGKNPLTGQPMTVYKWTNSSDVANLAIGNVTQVPYKLDSGSTVLSPETKRSYQGLMLVLQRRLKDRWQAQVSYVYSKTKGTIDNGSYSGVSSNQFENANYGLINTDGYSSYDRPHEVKVFAGYQIPKIDLSIDGYFRWMSGTPYTPYSRIRGLGWPFTTYVTPNLAAPGTYRNDNFNQTDLRLEKVFQVGFHRFGAYLDIGNLFNQSIVTARQTRYPYRNLAGPNGEENHVAFGDPTAVMGPRQFVIGGRWSF